MTEKEILAKLNRKNITPESKVAFNPELKLTFNPDKKVTYNLSKEQLRFIRNKNDNVLLVALAGCGKTLAIINRVIYLINNDVDPEKILLITFTVKAGEEMRNRINNKLSDISRFITCGTFHSFAVKMLRRYIPHGIKNFSILDASDALEIWLKVCNTTHAKTLFSLYSMMRNKMVSASSIINEKLDSSFIKPFKKAIKDYTNYKKKYVMYDFDDLLEIFYYYLTTDSIFRKKVSLYEHILIDELQDCNLQQLNIIKSLQKDKHISIYGVGDPSQSIYKFRGADHHLMESFPEMFNAVVLPLTTNYRSTYQILNLANAIGSNFTSVRWKHKMSGTYNGEKPYYIRVKDEHAQTNLVVNYINKFLKKDLPQEIAVLYRSNSSSLPIELALTKNNIPFEKRGGQSLFEMSHIKDILAFFKAAYYASDVLAWNRILLLHKGIGPKMAQKLYTKAFNNKPTITELDKILNTLKRLNKNPKKAVRLLYSYAEPILIEKYGKSWDKRQSSIKVFLDTISRSFSIKKMLTDISFSNVQKDQNKVILSTVHSFKGLEVNNVFIINCNEGKFPSDWFMYDGNIPKNKIKYPPDIDKLDEERRLFYVACTRARHNLIIISPMSDREYNDYVNTNVIKIENSTESTFISEIDIDSLANVLMPIKESETTNDRVLKQIYRDFE